MKDPEAMNTATKETEARTWLLAIPAARRAAVVGQALAAAARRGPVDRALEALYDAIEVQRDLGADFHDRDAITLDPPAVDGDDDDWNYQYEQAFAAAAARWRTEASEDSIRDAAVAAALAAAAEML